MHMYIDINLIGIVAGTLTVVAFLPQLHKVYQNKSAKDISWLWMLGFFTGVLLWAVYGVLDSSAPITLANTAMLMLGIVLITLKWKYGK